MPAPNNTLEFNFGRRVGAWPTTISLPGDQSIKKRRSDYGTKKLCPICGHKGHTKKFHIPVEVNGLRRCSRCSQYRPVSEYSIKTKRLSGAEKQYRGTRCRSCERSRAEYRRRNQTLAGRLYSLALWSRKWSRNNGFPCEVTADFLKRIYDLQSGRCYYSGVVMTTTSGRDAISIDRVDPQKPYFVDNVVLCRWMINSMKNSYTVQEFLSACSEVAVFQENRGICA